MHCVIAQIHFVLKTKLFYLGKTVVRIHFRLLLQLFPCTHNFSAAYAEILLTGNFFALAVVGNKIHCVWVNTLGLFVKNNFNVSVAEYAFYCPVGAVSFACECQRTVQHRFVTWRMDGFQKPFRRLCRAHSVGTGRTDALFVQMT